ncbi:cyanophycinase [Flavobacterium cyanobacteriorum]|uniref:Cyanophycinase n=1 Tax=Flavobacterium cyanobacteriorum TaxID=2022802 RepID=A0A255Z2N9_9FLAO|nr:cyanophycinase [Flavobacterium cyanobacteriorum]OYQ35712.1 cyanophycinase [Flavobacterium cyanobacteriorum]
MAVKGKLIIIGGAEDKGTPDDKGRMDNDTAVDDYYENGILRRVIDESVKKDKSRIEILTTASTVPEEIGDDYRKAFKRLNAENTGIINIKSREGAHDEELLKRLSKADIVMVTGGDQMRLTSILGGTPFLNMMQEKYFKEDFVYAGSSAGAAAASNNMVFQGTSDVSLFKGKVRVTSGLGFINNVIVDTHFVTRGRIGRLLQIVVANPRLLGIGLEENAALLVTNGSKMEAIGPGMIMLVDGRCIADSNFNDIDDGEAISIENVVVHVMSKYDIYDYKKHKLIIDHRNDRDE